MSMTGTYEWQEYYEAALVETDRAKLQALIQRAQAAIDARAHELCSNRVVPIDERQALDDALVGLSVLRREVS